MSERRRYVRYLLDYHSIQARTCTIAIPRLDADYRAVLLNISQGGVSLRFDISLSGLGLTYGETLIIRRCPLPELADCLRDRSGQVAWISDNRLGLAFAAALPFDLDDLLHAAPAI